MNTSRERIQSLVQKGALPSREAEVLLAAVGAPSRTGWRLLLDPLERFGAVQLTLVGLVGALVGMALEYSGLVFDGYLDLHITPHAWRLAPSAVRALAAWPLGAFVLWLVSVVAGRRGRLIDFLGLVGVARLPSVLLAIPIAVILAAHGGPVATPGVLPVPVPALLAITALGLGGVACFIVLSYRGFVTASGLRGPKRVVAFVAGTLLAEVASKIIVVSLV
jgi:hypothetical protein